MQTQYNLLHFTNNINNSNNNNNDDDDDDDDDDDLTTHSTYFINGYIGIGNINKNRSDRPHMNRALF